MESARHFGDTPGMAKKKQATESLIRDRVRELRRVPANTLVPHPLNWRTHSPEQANALDGLLSEVGFAGAVLARELPDGTLQLIDGHLRTDRMKDAEVPVLVLDVTEAEAAKILATYDPLGAMAGADAAKLDELLASVQTDNAALIELLESTAKDAGCEWARPEFGAAGIDEQGRLDQKAKTVCPNCSHEF